MITEINKYLKLLDEMKGPGTEMSFARTPNGLRYRVKWENAGDVFQYSKIISTRDLSEINETNEHLVTTHILAELTHELHPIRRS